MKWEKIQSNLGPRPPSMDSAVTHAASKPA